MKCQGGCLCGAVRYDIDGEPDWQGHCHCRRCHRHSGAASLSFARFRETEVSWIGARRALYRSSDEIYRGFCPCCGSVISFERPTRRRIAVTAGSMDGPTLLRPTEHIFGDDRCAWLRLDGGLPWYPGFSDGLAAAGPPAV
ncbi:MAG: GFA family protein [Paracoccaceae bacterium]